MLSLIFAWLFLFWDYSQRDAPNFLSLLYRFWLSGLFSFERLTAYEIRNHHCLLVPKESFWCCSLYYELRVCDFNVHLFFGLTERLPCPRFKSKVLICLEQKTPTSLARRGWLGIIFLITPVFGNWKKCLYIISKVCSKAYCMRLWYCFVILPLKACSFLSRVKYHKENIRIVKTNGWIQDKHMQCINETEFDINR